MAGTFDESSWGRVALPVLRGLLEAEREDRRTDLEGLRELTPDASEREFHNALEDLCEDGYILGRAVAEPGSPYPGEYLGLRLAPRGRRAVRDWPGDDAFEALMIALDAAIDRATEPAERTKLEKLKATAQEVGQGVLTSILTSVLTQAAGLP